MPIPTINRPPALVRTGFFFLTLLITGCQGKPPSATPTAASFFLPPTEGLVSNTASAQHRGPAATPTPDCSNQLRFEEDLTVPDGTELEPEEQFSKRWLVTNTGTCSWNEQYHMGLISGLALGADQIQGLTPARSGSQAVIEIVFVAPENPGRYNSWWQAFDPSGQRFGDPFYVDILVSSQQ